MPKPMKMLKKIREEQGFKKRGKFALELKRFPTSYRYTEIDADEMGTRLLVDIYRKGWYTWDELGKMLEDEYAEEKTSEEASAKKKRKA